MSVPENILKLAISYAHLSKHRFQVGAVIYESRCIIGAGSNDAVKTHPKSPHPYKVRDAEFNAVLSATRNYYRMDLRGLSIYVHRIKKDGSPGLAKPCAFCAKMLALVGIEDVNYSEG